MLRILTRCLAVLVAAIVAVVLAPACSQGPLGGDPPAIPAFLLPQGKATPLEVVFASPQGALDELPAGAAATVVFNQPMVPLEGLGDRGSPPPLTLSPAVAGRWEWRGTATLVFRPQQELPFGAHFQVRVPAGLKSFAGQALARDYTFEFDTPTSKLEASIPSDGDRFVRLDRSILLVFNQSVSAEVAAEAIFLRAGDRSVPIAVRAATDAEWKELQKESQDDQPRPDSHRSRVLVVDPVADLDWGTPYTLELKAGLKASAQATRGTPKSRTLKFRTVNHFALKGLDSDGSWRPGDSLGFTFSNPVAPRDLVKNLVIEPTVKVPDWYADDDYHATEIFLNLPLKARTAYRVVLGADLEDEFGNRLGKAVEKTFTTTDFAPVLRMPTGQGILEADGDLSVPVGLLNLDRLHVRMARVEPQDLVPLLQADRAFWSDEPYAPPGGFQVDEEWRPQVPLNQRVDRPVDLRRVLGERQRGLVYLQVQASQGQETWDQRLLVQVTDLGLTGKFSAENTLLWTTDLSRGQPRGDLELELRDQGNRVVWSGRSDARGLARASGWADLGLPREDSWSTPRLCALVRRGDDLAFLDSSASGGISAWDFDLPFLWNPPSQTWQARAFTERGLYRAGEQVHFKGTVRRSQGGHWVVPEQVGDLDFTVYDSRDQKIQSGRLKVSSFGSFDHTLALDRQAPSGGYRIKVELPEKLRKATRMDEALTEVGFRVEAYRPAQFEVKVDAAVPACVLGETARATIRGRYLFGAPMSGDEVRWSARLEPTTFQPEAWREFRFGTPRHWGEDQRDQERVLLRGQGTLDEKGHREVPVPTRGVTFEGPARLVMEGTVTSASRQAVSGRTSVLVHPAAVALGLRTAGTLRPAGSPVTVDLVAVDLEGRAQAGCQVKVDLLRREWTSVRKAGAGGRYEWVSEARDSQIRSQAVQSGQAPVSFTVTPPKAGLYVVRATASDAGGRQAVSECEMYAWGGDYVAWARDDEDRIELVPDRQEYAPGQTATILVKSPFERAQALVTVERELVLDQYVVEVEGTADTVEVPIRAGHVPNVFVSVMLIQGRVPDAGFGPDGMDLGKPSFRIGYLNLPVVSDSKRLKVEVSPAQGAYQPQQEATVRIQVRDAQGQPAPAEVCLAVVDEGVLSLIGYQTPDYFDGFYGTRPLAVRTTESRLNVIGQRSYGAKGEDQGGGGGLVGDYRADFATTAFWSPHLVTDAQGRAEVSFRLPDSLTRFRVMAVAQTVDSRFGSGEAGVEVRKPLLLQPSVPRFARMGDRFQAGVLVFNNTGASGEVLVEAEASGLEVGRARQVRVRVEPGQEKEVLFDFQAPTQAEAQVGFRASLGDHRDSLKLDLPVRLSAALETVATSGVVRGEAQQEGLKVPGGVLPGSARLQATVSGSALSGVEAAVNWLLDYPYGCLEQRLSRLVPLLLAGDLVGAFGNPELDAKALRTRVQEEVDSLASFQVEGGGFSLWPKGTKVHDYLTTYAVRTLLEARERGFRVDRAVLDGARASMKQALNRTQHDYPYSDREKATLRACLLETLTRLDYRDSATLSSLFKDRQDLSVEGKVHLMRAAARLDNPAVVSTLRRELEALARVEAQTAWFEEGQDLPWLYGSTVRTTGSVLEALLEQGDFALAPRVVRWLMEAREEGHWGTTQQDVAALRALLAYRRRYEKDPADLEATVRVAGQQILKAHLTRSAPLASSDTDLDGRTPGDTLKVDFQRAGQGPLHYDLRLRYAPAQDPPARDQGFSVFRVVRPLSGEGVHVGPFTPGQTYRVTLTVLTPTERRYVVVDDPVPAGFEVVQTTFETESDQMRQVLEEGGLAQPWFGTFNHFEIEDSRVLLFADGLQAGEHTFEYLVRAMLPGLYRLPATRAEEMYHPEIFGTTAVQVVEVKPVR